MRFYWASMLNQVGIGFGYSNHQRQLRKALEGIGIEIVDEPGGADIAVSIVPAGNYVRVEGKYNVLYTMYEAVDLPPKWIPKLNEADLIVVPCRHNKRLFERYTKKPIEVCWEGVEVDKFVFKRRAFPVAGEPFVYLWFGASNERKGYKHMIVAWQRFCERNKEIANGCLLVMKTTQTAEGLERVVGYDAMGNEIKKVLPKERVVRYQNVIFDSRVLPVMSDGKVPGLVNMYHDAHCFVFPTMGEGFGLTLAEAMATGLPCIYTNWSGPVDILSEKEGYPVKWKLVPIDTLTPLANGDSIVELHTYAASCDIDHLVRRMEQVYYDYETAVKKGELAAERIRRYFTWELSARSFVGIIQKYVGGD